MEKLKTILLLTALAFAVLPAHAADRTSVVFYNVENLYDTIPSSEYDDSGYTPGGRMKWGTERYGNKLRNIARVLDEIAADVVGLAEIESETAVRDLVMALRTDYNYIYHSGGSDSRGMGVAMLYKGDKFVPEHSGLIRASSSREVLYVRGELIGQRVDLLVCHLPSQMNGLRYRDRALAALYRLADSIHNSDRDACVILMGDFNSDPKEKIMKRRFHTNKVAVDGSRPLFCPFASLASRGMGSYVYNNRWRLFDNIFLSTRLLGGGGLRYDGCRIFIRPWLMDGGTVSRKGYPLRTFASGTYLNGYSDHLPVFVTLTEE